MVGISHLMDHEGGEAKVTKGSHGVTESNEPRYPPSEDSADPDPQTRRSAVPSRITLTDMESSTDGSATGTPSEGPNRGQCFRRSRCKHPSDLRKLYKRSITSASVTITQRRGRQPVTASNAYGVAPMNGLQRTLTASPYTP
jgi:hypothetical protein